MDEAQTDSELPGEASGPSRRPTNFVAGVMHDRAEVDRALEELVALGVDRNSIGVFSGERGVEGFHNRPRRWLSDLSDESQFIDRFEEEMRQGGIVVGVPVAQHSEDDFLRVEEILRSHGAHAIVSGTRWTFTTDV